MTANTPRGYTVSMNNTALVNRLRRVEGQLVKLQQEIANDADCADVIPQFLAVKGALSAALQQYVMSSVGDCVAKDKEKLTTLLTLLTK